MHSPDTNPKSTYFDVNTRSNCMQIPPVIHELKDHNNINFESNRSDVMMYLTPTSDPPKSCVVHDDDPYLSAVYVSE